MATKPNLRSTQIAKIVDLWAEGEIVGLVDGAKSIYFDEVPVQNYDGTFNFDNVEYTVKTGTNDQTYVEGYSNVENEVIVNTKVMASSAVTRSITNTQIDRVRITLSVPAIYEQNQDDGKLKGTSVSLKAALSDNGGPFIDQRLGTEKTKYSTYLSGTSVSFSTVSEGFEIGLTIGFSQPTSYGYIGVYNSSIGVWQGRVEYKKQSDSTWIVLQEISVSENEAPPAIVTNNIGMAQNQNTSSISYGVTQNQYRYASRSVQTGYLPSGLYQVRLVQTKSIRSTCDIRSAVLYTAQNDMVISGTTQSKYQKSWEVILTGTGPWQLRITRTTADNTSQYIQNDTYWDSMTQIIDGKFRYPNSAYISVQLNAENFNNLPVRGYDVKLLKVKVPANYDPATRTYTGGWDGTFKTEWTDNPAWCFYDLCTNSRYGLGNYLNIGQIDKWSLYTIAQYCDELIPDGNGGVEPRFTCNVYIQSRQQAYRIIQDMASIFRAMSYWDTGSLTLAQDAPADAMHLFTNSNVQDGAFSYSGSAAKARHTIALVTWNDPDDLYRQKVEYVSDDEAIARFGPIETEVTAMGCTSRGQANRVGKWLLYSERYESEIVTFVTGLEGVVARPGSLIKVADNNRAGTRLGGRISSATKTTIVVDSELSLPFGTYNLMAMLPDGSVETQLVATITGNTILVSPGFSSAPQVQGQWLLTGASIEAQTFRILSVQEQDNLKIQITALKHDPDKYSYVEDGLALQSRVITLLDGIPESVSNLTVTEALYATKTDVLNRVSISWDSVTYASKYRVVYSVNGDNEVTVPDTSINSVDILDAPTGNYEIKVYSIGPLGTLSNMPTSTTAIILGKTAPPSNVANFTYTIAPFSGVTLRWDRVSDIDIAKYEIRTGLAYSTSTLVGETKENYFTIGLLPIGNKTYWIKAVDTTGNYSLLETSVVTTIAALPNIGTITPVFQDNLTNALITLSWTDVNPELGLSNYLISYNSTTLTSKSSSIVLPADWTGSRTFTIKTVDSQGNQSTGTSLAVSKALPNPSGAFTTSVSNNQLTIKWDPATRTSLPIAGYEVRSSDTGWGSSGYLFKGNFLDAIVTPSLGANTWYVRPYDTSNAYPATSLAITYTRNIPFGPTSLTYVYADTSLTNATVTLDWVNANPVFGLDRYKITYGSEVHYTKSNTITLPADWLGDRTYSIVTIDMLGAESTATTLVATKALPSPATNLRAQVIDNNVLLYWTLPAKTSLPIQDVLVKKGAVYATAEVIGNKSGGFTSLQEINGGTYTYWIAVRDTDNNYSTPISLTTTVSQPPDFVFNAQYFSTFSGTKTSAINEQGGVLLPVNTTETWTTHFTSRSWADPAAQIAAGYPIFIQPNNGTGSYVEVFDYGTILGSSQISVNYTGTTIAGTPNLSFTIGTSLDNITYNTFSGQAIFATNFRYIKITATVTTVAATDLYLLNTLNVLLNAKQITDAGTVSALASDASGTIVNFGKEFVDVASITASPSGTSGLSPVYDFLDSVINGTYTLTTNVATINATAHNLLAGQKVRLSFTSGTAPNGVYTVASVVNANQYLVNITTGNTSGNISTYPESFRVYLFNSAGTRASGTVSWAVRGY
jgi:predicted phage tail protein